LDSELETANAVLDVGEVRRILLVKPSSLGDVIHAIPTAAALRRRFPAAHLAWLVEEELAGIVRGVRCVDEVIVSGRRRWLGALRAGRGVAGAASQFWGLARRLRAARYDLVVDLQGLLKSAVFVAATGARLRLGLSSGREGSRFACTHLVNAPLAEHAVERYLRAAWALGAPDGPREFPIAIPPDAAREADHILGDAGPATLPAGKPATPPAGKPAILPAGKPRALAVLHPAARWPTKLWTPEAFAAVGDALADHLGASLVITGSAGDASAAEAVRAHMRRPALNLAGRTPLLTLAAILRQAAVMVTVDSGPMHLAAALGTPLVALFGPTAPSRTGPYGADLCRVLRAADLPCVPCLSRRCRIASERLCMRSLDPGRVTAEALALARVIP
jgi:lipopolysaccharide heptosyltransferase I